MPTIEGTTVDDVLTGTAGGDEILGYEGDDELNGLAGGDALDGGFGDDQMTGGPGDDYYYVDSYADVIIEQYDEGYDRVVTQISYAIPDDLSIEAVYAAPGPSNIDLTGNNDGHLLQGNDGNNFLSGAGGNDVLVGGRGNDILDGGLGTDQLHGGLGDDTYYLDSLEDTIVEGAGGGRDRVAALASIELAAGWEIEVLEAITLTDTTALTLIGNGFAQTIIGNVGTNTLRGEGGNDVLIALDGDDTLDGGTGADLMLGGVGTDIYYVDNLGDQIVEADGNESDRARASASWVLAAGVAVEFIETVAPSDTAAIDLTGNEYAQQMIGNAGANRLDGGAGNDVLYGLAGDDQLLGGLGNDFLDGGLGADTLDGGAGDDIFLVTDAGDTIVEAANEGTDRVAAVVSYVLNEGAEVELLEAITQSDTAAIDLAGNSFGQRITANAGDNVLHGGGGSDLLFGLAGNDRLNGGLGNDYLDGGAGADTFVFDTPLSSSTNRDTIGQTGYFAPTEDTIELDDAVFTALSPGALPASAFFVGTQAHDADDRIIYWSHGNSEADLYYDPDGTGPAAAVQFATIWTFTQLTEADFIVT